MKTLRYILIVIGVLSVVSVAAATFGTPYQPQRRGIQYTQASTHMPVASMNSTASMMMKSGSELPMAAQTGVVMTGSAIGTYTSARLSSRPRRIVGDEDDGEDDHGYDNDDTQEMVEPDVPLGDAVLPLLLCAMLFAGVIAVRKKRTLKG